MGLMVSNLKLVKQKVTCHSQIFLKHCSFCFAKARMSTRARTHTHTHAIEIKQHFQKVRMLSKK